MIKTQSLTATSDEDYEGFTEGITLTFADATSPSVEGVIDIYANYEIEGPETFKIVLSSVSEGTTGNTTEAVVYIVDVGRYFLGNSVYI